MHTILFCLYVILFCFSASTKTSSHILKPHGKETIDLHNIGLILNQFGYTTSERNTFWELPLIREMRVLHKPHVPDIIINNGHFAQAIHDIRAIISSHHSHQPYISKECYTVLLCEIVDRRLNGRPRTPREPNTNPVKTVPSESSLHSSESSSKHDWPKIFFCTEYPQDISDPYYSYTSEDSSSFD